MASTPSQSSSESAIVEQVITEFFAKSLHIILESRSPYVSSRNHSVDHFISSPSSSSSLSSSRPRDKWFNLALQDCPAALENFDIWRQSNLEPLVVDIILIHRQWVPDVASCLLRNLAWNHELALEPKSEKIVERWILRYESVKRCSSNLKPKNQSSKKNSRASSHLDETKLSKRSSHIDNVRSQLTVATQTQTCLLESIVQTKGESPRSSNSLRDTNLHKEFEYCKDEVINLPDHASSSTYKPYSRNSSASSCLGEFDDWEISCPFVDEEGQTESNYRIQISNNKDQLGERPATGDLAPVQRSSDAAVGALIVMLKGARPLREDLPNSVRSLQCSEVPSGNPEVQPDKECTPHVEQPGYHAVSLTTTLLKSKTANALEELRRYKEVKESIIEQSAPKEIR
ncbi:autophagy-related protein 13b-like isoform X2 [Zingiber officinale]|uniref:autophagy-related protein 13b-like isoform X2 n=1 Tax=Zingiber officinale TaxID=94328 RepID=UPI001C4C4C8A|nr:autophagy-related protein 13b-like isoform X2 [Zingiber officinale]